jgi:hypothetical protein
MDNKMDLGTKNIRGRFIIQEIIEPKEEEEENEIEGLKTIQSHFTLTNLQYNNKINSNIPTYIINKRRNSCNNSKFKINSKYILQAEKSNKFLVYDLISKKYVDVNKIFKKYNEKFEFNKNLFKRSTNKKRSINFVKFYEKINKVASTTELSLPLVKKKDFKRIETSVNLHLNLNINSDSEIKTNVKKVFVPVKTKAKHYSTQNMKEENKNVNIYPKKNLFPFVQKFISFNDKNDLLAQERVISLFFESQNFTECVIKDCQFSL